jgi:hypothetical protein
MRVLLMMLLALSAALLVAACGAPGDGTVDGCQGSYLGPYTGSESGNITSTLRPRGRLVSTFVSAVGAFQAVTATVTDGGSLMSMQPARTVNVQGTFDLMECTATGTWTRMASTGTFELRKE